jgi:hypothetical protein
MKEKKKEIYESPLLEVVEFDLVDSITASQDFGSGLVCGEESYGGGL